MRKVAVPFVLLTLLAIPTQSFGQIRAFTEDLFEKKTHDFGTVARAAQIDYVFEFTNNTENAIEMSSVRTSCNCTTPTVVKKVVQPGEKGGVKCRFNTRSFLGNRRATVTATFSRPYFAEVQLEVRGYVRRDIVVHPPAIDFKNIPEGKGGSQKVGIEYAGNNDWKIKEVTASNPNIELELQEKHRGNGLVGYELVAKLKPSAEPGFLNAYQVVLKTNDNRLNEFPISVSGKVEETISLSPKDFDLAAIKKGETIQKRLVLKRSRRFWNRERKVK